MRALSTTIQCTIRLLWGPDFIKGFLDVIRSFRPCDLTVEEAGGILRERIRRGVTTYVAEYEGQVIGTASLLVDQKFINSGGKAGIVEDVIVLPAFQGCGVGRELMAALQQRAAELGCYKLGLYCSADLVAYYERLGFNHSDAFLRLDLS